MSETCYRCHREIPAGEDVGLEIQTCESSFNGPAEYEDVSLHPECYTKMTDPDYDEHLRDEATDRKLAEWRERTRV